MSQNLWAMKRLWLLLLLALSLSPSWGQEATLSGFYDLVINNGRVLDPESGLDTIANVGIQGDKIAVVSGRELRGRKAIDATGLVVAPGFIDLNSAHHQTFGMRMQAYDGVTTALDLGSGRLPAGETYSQLEANGAPLNFGVGASWAYAKIWVMGQGDGRPDASWNYLTRTLKGTTVPWSGLSNAESRKELVSLVEDALDRGALAVSIDARMAPDLDYSEAISLLELARQKGVVAFFRGYHDDLRGVADLLALAAATEAQTHLCQFNAKGNENKSRAVQLLKGSERLGLKISASSDPFGAESAPARDFPADKRDDYYDDFRVPGEGLNAKRFRELRGRKSPVPVTRHFLWTELVREMSREEQENLTGADQGKVRDDKESLRQSLMLEGGAIASSALPWLYLCEQGAERPSEGIRNSYPLNATHNGQWPPQLPKGVRIISDPRSASTFTRVLSDWVAWDEPPTSWRMSPLQAIEKMSLRPAQILEDSVPAMKTKGRLQAGMDADIVIFDPKEVRPRVTYEDATLHSIGMKHVLVNGQFLIEDWVMKMSFPGRAVRRPQS